MKKSQLSAAFAGSLLLVSGVAWADEIGDETEAEPRFVLNQDTRLLLDRSQRTVTQDKKGNKHLVDNHRHVLLARVGVDGKVEMFCADNVHSAEKWAANEAKTELQP
ncbi:MAG: hypothetical protein AB8B96_13950 [Lysobacterales bacterium]